MPIALRPDFDAKRLRAAACASKDVGQTRRLLVLAAVYERATRTEAARIGSVTLQIVRDWVLKLNEHGPDGLIDRKAPGQPALLDDAHRAALSIHPVIPSSRETGPLGRPTRSSYADAGSRQLWQMG